MASDAQILDDLRTIIATETKRALSALEMGARLDELGLDSLNRIRLVIGIERKYGVEIDESTAMGLTTISDLVLLISHHTGGK